MTYPQREVVELLESRFVCYSVNEREPAPADKELMRRHRLIWSPGLLFFEPRGAELRRFVGFRPPEELVAELRVVLGLHEMVYQRFAEAAEELGRAAEGFGDREGAAEALYWRAIAVYRSRGRDYDALRTGWNLIRERFPESSWWPRADVWDAQPTGRRGG